MWHAANIHPYEKMRRAGPFRKFPKHLHGELRIADDGTGMDAPTITEALRPIYGGPWISSGANSSPVSGSETSHASSSGRSSA